MGSRLGWVMGQSEPLWLAQGLGGGGGAAPNAVHTLVEAQVACGP